MTRFKKKPTVLQKAKKAKGAKAQSSQIQTLARQVDYLKESNRERSIPTFYTTSYSSRTNSYPLIIPLTSGPSTTGAAETTNTPADDMVWTKCFNTAGVTPSATRQNLKLYSQFVDVILEPGNEEDMLIHTLFLIKLNNDEGIAQRTYNSTGFMTTMVDNEDYVSNAQRDGAQVWLNPERYTILKRWEMHTCGDEKVEPTPGASGIIQNMSGAINRWGFKISYAGRHLKSTGLDQTISHVRYVDLPPHDKYFLLAFSDNSTLDTENPLISVSSVIKARMF